MPGVRVHLNTMIRGVGVPIVEVVGLAKAPYATAESTVICFY